MKDRNIPFGYICEGGKMQLSSEESNMVKEIFEKYANGDSLKQIAQNLTGKTIKCTVRKVVWNKPKIKRIFEDKRYLSDEIYPQIIGQELFDKVNKIKKDKGTAFEEGEKPKILELNLEIRCPYCNSVMGRDVDKRLKTREMWICKNKDCKTIIKKNDEELYAEIIQVIKKVVDDPGLMIKVQEEFIETNIELIRLNKEINNLYSNCHVNRDALKDKLYRYTELRYKEISANQSITQKLKEIFTMARIANEPIKKLIDRTVDAIKIYSDGTVGIVLENKQEIT